MVLDGVWGSSGFWSNIDAGESHGQIASEMEIVVQGLKGLEVRGPRGVGLGRRVLSFWGVRA